MSADEHFGSGCWRSLIWGQLVIRSEWYLPPFRAGWPSTAHSQGQDWIPACAEKHPSEAPLAWEESARGKHPSYWTNILGGNDGPGAVSPLSFPRRREPFGAFWMSSC